MVILIAIIVISVIIFAFTCFYASWEERIDRRRRQRVEDRAAWELAKMDWQLPPNPARGREFAG